MQTTQDTTDEDNETFTLMLSNSSNAALAADSTATGTIDDDGDAPPSVGVADAAAAEGGDVTFTVTLSAVSGKTVTATWTASIESGNTAEAADLRSTTTGTVTLMPGDTTATFTVATAQDTTDEANETFTVTLSRPSNATLAVDPTATGTIGNEDQPEMGFDSDGESVLEETGTIQFVVVLDRPGHAPITAHWETVDLPSGSSAAAADVDYTAASGTLRFAPGETKKTITITITNDTILEPLEEFSVRLSGTDDAIATLGRSSSVGGIVDRDEATIAIAEETTVDEDAGTVTLTLSASAMSTDAYVFNYRTADGTAAAGADYTAASGRVRFASGDTEQTITIVVLEDETDEDQEAFEVQLVDVDGVTDNRLTLPDPARVLIDDDDDPPVVSVEDATAEEGDKAAFAVTLSAVSGREVTVDWAASVETGDTATAGTDYTAASGTLTIAAGDQTGTVEVVTLSDDDATESNETFTLTLSNPSNVTLATEPTATGTIVDELPVVTIAADESLLIESAGAAAGFTLSRTEPTAAELTVTVAVTQQEDRDLLPDGAAAARTVTFAEGSATATLTVALDNDDFAEAVGQLTVEVQAGMGYTVGDPGSATVAVVDGDTGLPTPANLMASPGAVAGEVVLSWDAPARNLTFELHQYRYKTDGNYAGWKDIPNSGQHVFGPGYGSNLTGYTVTGLVGGQVHTFQVRTFNLRSDGITTDTSDPSNEAMATPLVAQVTLHLTDALDRAVENDKVLENAGTITVTATVAPVSATAFTVTVTASPVAPATGADFDLGTGRELSFAAAATGSTGTVTIGVVDDDDAEPNDVVTVSGTVSDAAITAPADVTLTIINDDEDVSFDIAVDAPATVDEDAGTASVTVTLTTGQNRAPTIGTLVSYYRQRAQTATPDADYTAPPLIVATVPAAAFSQNAAGTAYVAQTTFTIGILDDSLDEADETIVFRVDTGYYESPAHTLTIIDDDDPPAVSFGAASYAVDEGASVAVTVELSEASGREVEVPIAAEGRGGATAQGETGADWSGVPESVTFAAGETQQSFTLTALDDALDEGDESVALSFGTLPAEATAGSVSAATVALGDDDDPPVVSVADATAVEGAPVKFTVALTAVSGREVTVDWAASVETGDTATAGTDYTAASGKLTIAAGVRTGTVEVVTLSDDDATESNETFTLTLSNPSNATLATEPTATGTIVDELPVVTIAADKEVVVEHEAAAGFTLSRTGSTAAELTVTVAVTQEVDRDLLPEGAAAARTVTFAEGSVTAALSVTLENDDLRELPGELTVEVQAGMGYTVGAPGSATVEMRDTDTGRPQPANLMASAGAGAGEVVLSWDAHAPYLVFTRHQYRYKTDGDYPETWIDIPNSGLNASGAGDGSNLTGYTATGLVGGQLHTFQVRTSFSPDTSDPSNEAMATPPVAQVTLHLTDDLDRAVENDKVLENAGTITVTATVAPVSATAFTVTVAASPVAPATGADFELSTGRELSFAAAATGSTGAVTIRVVDDDAAEPHDVVTVSGTVSDAAITAPADVTLTIINDDEDVSYDMAVDAPATVDEDAGTASVTVTLTTRQNRAPTIETQVSYHRQRAQTATPDADYTTPPPAIVATVPVAAFSQNAAGTAYVAQTTFTIGIIDDSLDEADETIVFEVSTSVDRAPAHTLTIIDDDDPPAVSFGAASYAVDEGASVAVTVELSEASGREVEVPIAAAGRGGATAQGETGADWSGVPESVTFATGQTQQSFTLTALDDALDEGDESVALSFGTLPAGATAGSVSAATVALGDDDDPPVVSVEDATAEEGDPVKFTVTLSAASGREVTVNWDAGTLADEGDTAMEGTDYTAALSTLTFRPGDTAKTVMVQTTQDTAVEANETFTLTLWNASNAMLAADPTATGTIVDPPTLSVADASATEASPVTFTVTMLPASTQTVTVNWATSVETGDTATSGTDFTAVTATTLTFMPGDTTATVTVQTTEDTTDEANETFTVTLSNPSSNAILAVDPTATGTIGNDDKPEMGFESGSKFGIEEVARIHFPVVLDRPGHAPITVQWETGDLPSGSRAAADVDYTAASGTLTFAPGETEKTIIITIINDTTLESLESFEVRLSGTDDAIVTLGRSSIVGRIIDRDEATIAITEETTVDEDAGTVTLTLSASAPSTVVYLLDYRTADGTAAAGEDYTAASGQVTFAAGDTEQTITIVVLEDETDEDQEDFEVHVDGASDGRLTLPGPARVLIEDNDDPPTVSVADATAEEGDPVKFTVALTAVSGREVTVNWATSVETGDTATAGTDFTAVPATTLTFRPGETEQAVTVQTTDDTIDEGNETFTVTLSRPSNATLAVDPTATGTITDDYDDASAQPQTSCAPNPDDIWCGVVTVMEHSFVGESYDGFLESPESVAGDLSEKNFTYGVNRYTIDAILVGKPTEAGEGRVLFSLTSELTESDKAALVLYVGSTAIPLAVSGYFSGGGGGGHWYFWEGDAAQEGSLITPGPGLDWRSETTVTVRLREASTTCTPQGAIWCGVVTPGDLAGEYGFLNQIGLLSDTDFEHDGTPYTIDEVSVSDSGQLRFSLTADLTAAHRAAVALHVDGSSGSFALQSASHVAGSNTYAWLDTGLDWSSVPPVTLRLRHTAPTFPGKPTNLTATGKREHAD